MNRDEDSTIRNLAANILRRADWPDFPEALLQVLNDYREGPRFRSFAAQFLGDMIEGSPGGIRDRVISRLRVALNDRHPEVRREALWALARQQLPVAHEASLKALTATGTEADIERALGIRCVEALDLKAQAIETVRKLAKDGGELARVQAIVTLAEWQDEQSRPYFEEAAQMSIVQLQQAGKAALQRLDAKRPVIPK
jgi:hypothetical protein